MVADFDGNTFRTVYTVRFAKAVYVLHAFQKKSRRAIATPKGDLDLIETRARQRGLRSMAQKPLIPVTASSGNVFADIGVPEPEEELAKAQLASRIREIVRSSRLTQVAAAGVMGIDQPKVSAVLNGRLSSFSSERLMRLLTRLGQDVEIVVKSKPRRRQRGRIRVVQEARA